MQIIDEELPQKISDATATMPLSQAKQIYTAYKNKELAMPYEIPEEHKTERVVLGTLQRWGQGLEVVPEGLGILGGEIMMLDGKILQHTPFKNIAQSEMKLGEKMIMGANSSLMAKRKRQAQELLPMTEEESSSVLSKSISTVTDYGSQILLALATGGITALATMGARMAGETAVAGLEEYKQAHPEDKDLTGFFTTKNLSKEFLLNAGKTAINLYVEKAIGVPKQVSQFKKALKTPAIGAIGVAKAAGKGYAMGFGEEWATETIQGITDTTFDAFLGRYKDMPELAKAYNDSVVDAVYAGIFGGGFGASGHVLARGKAIGKVKEMMSNVVPEQDLEMVATAIVDNHIASVKQMIGTQIQLSTQLRDKHGEIFNAMNAAAKQAMMESGVANTITEDEIAQHASELSEMFADQVLAEATKRNVPIYDVINGQDIVYDAETKELRLAPKGEKAGQVYRQWEDIGNKTKFTKSEYDLKKLMQTFPPRQEFEDVFFQKGKSSKGTYDPKSKVIKLFEKADASTLDHELAHFWLDNMWTYATSGSASEAYQAQFNAVKDFLGVRPDQMYLTYNQHEKFASAYEKYIHRGIIPNSMIGNVFDNYERFIRNVYDSINDIMYTTKKGQKRAFKLTPEIIKFFDSMIRGGIDTTAATDLIANEVRNEEAQKADTETMKEVNSVVNEMPEREVQAEVKPVEVEGKKKESRLYERMKGVVGDEGKVEYNVANIQEQREKAREMWNENPEKAKAILAGKETSDDILRQALYTEQQRLALENGDTNTFLNSLRKQTAEATRMGQELSALRGVVEDITDPAYWIRSAETEALKNLAKKQSKNLQNAMGNTPLMELTARLDVDIKALQKDVASKATDEEKMKALKDGVKSIADKYQGLEQPDTVFNQIDWDNEELANDYIENKVKEKLGIALPKDIAKAFIQTARELDTLSKQRDEMGNPTEAFFAKKDELERMRNSHTPTSRAKVLISTIGRANMLTAPSTSVLNVVSNSLNYSVENVVRKVGNVLEGKTNDNIVDKGLIDKYRAKAWKVFWDTGYDMSFMSSLLDERLYKGETVSHSEGDGAIRAVGRFAEKYVFSRLISTPDIYFKSVLGFTNYLGNEATDMAYKEGLTGEKAKARADELFKDAIKIEPETEEGKQIRAKAQTDALILTFQQDTKFAQMLLDVRNAINKGTGDIGIGDILSPFIKTPANIISMGFDAAVGPFASPVNLLGALTDIKNKNYRSARVLQAAKQTTTALLAYTAIALLASLVIDDDDYIPDYAQLSQKERAAVRARGGSYGSIKVGGQYVSTDFFGPFEMPLVTFLNTRRTGNLLKGIAGGVISKGVDAPVLKDILGSSEALKEMATSKDDIISAVGENVANAAITRLTPNALNAIAKILDGKERKANTIAEKLVSRIPFARSTLEERISVATGEAQEIQALNTLLFGSRGKYEETAPLAKEISRLASVGEAVNIVDPTRSGVLSKLSEQEKRNIQDMFAKEFAKKASKEITSASYNRKSDDGKKDALDGVRKSVVDDIKRKFRKQIKFLQKSKK